MSLVFNEFVKKSVFYSKEKPELLTNLLENIVIPENIGKDITIESITVANGTALAAAKLKLPTELIYVTAKGVPYSYTVTWGSTTTPTYSAEDAADYAITGTIGGLPSFITNTGSKVVKATISV